VKLQNKVVVITGSGSGIGEACARRFAAEGAKVVVTDMHAEGVDRVSREIGSVGVAADITLEDSVRQVADLARRTYGDVDIWFSNAGLDGAGQSAQIPDDSTWSTQWSLHVMAHVYAAREVLPAMVARGDGYLLQTASVVAFLVRLDKAAYSVTKHAALAFSEWLAATYGPQGIKVSCFCPGPMLTPMLLDQAFPSDHPAMLRAATPEQVADRLVAAIDEERFLILDSDTATEALAAKARDYEQWIDQMSAP
jgi:NAD(P)-dependent dehydrogenase (short-subunit alcohol dehydrogenase family)